MLSGIEIIKQSLAGRIKIISPDGKQYKLYDPAAAEQDRIDTNDPLMRKVNPNSVNLTLGNTVMVYKNVIPKGIAPWIEIKQSYSVLDWYESPRLLNYIRDMLRPAHYMPNPRYALDSKKENDTISSVIPPQGIIIRPGILYLMKTHERTSTLEFAPMLEGCSGGGRLGIGTHRTAGFGDNGFGATRDDGEEGNTWTLEIDANHPVRLYPYQKICQIAYHDITGEHNLYNGSYKNQTGIISSRMYKDINNQERY
ncbi:MAG: hypothetical protein LBK26_03840 [Rickettsiales bacterium]|jgi:dCTP deaminase|nr:hypothetical protein [Rickettsiales bacterium]